MKSSCWLAMVAVMGMSIGCGVMAAEHPEHPMHGAPAVKAEVKPLTMDQVANVIESYIKEDSRIKGGYFLYYDAKSKETLRLTLDKVHRDRLSQTAPGTYFACSDFKDPAGKVYDLDFWMHEGANGELKVTEIMIHKDAGKPRYNWIEEGGVWKQKTVEG